MSEQVIDQLQRDIDDLKQRNKDLKAKHGALRTEAHNAEQSARAWRRKHEALTITHRGIVSRVTELEERLAPLETLWDVLKHGLWERQRLPETFEDRYVIRLPEEEAEALCQALAELRRGDRAREALARVEREEVGAR